MSNFASRAQKPTALGACTEDALDWLGPKPRCGRPDVWDELYEEIVRGGPVVSTDSQAPHGSDGPLTALRLPHLRLACEGLRVAFQAVAVRSPPLANSAPLTSLDLRANRLGSAGANP